jgi:molybdopterin converting factor small subunit
MSSGVRVRLPPILRAAMGQKASIEGEGTTIGEVLRNISDANPSLGLHLLDEGGNPRRNIICLHGGELVRARDFSAHAVGAGDELVLTNALAGG